MPPKKRKRGNAAGGEPEPRAPLRVLQARNSAPYSGNVPDRALFTGESRRLNDLLANNFDNETRPVQPGDTLHDVLGSWREWTNNSSDGAELEEIYEEVTGRPLIYREETPPPSPTGAGRGFIEPHSLNRMVVRF